MKKLLCILMLVSASARADITSNLEMYLAFDDGTGTNANDSTANNRDGTLTNGPTWGTGHIGGCVVFDGSDDFVSVADTAGLRLTGNHSVACWVKFSSGQTNKGLIGKYWSGGNERAYALFTANDGTGSKVACACQSNGSDFNSGETSMSSTGLADGTWHHVVYTCVLSGAITIYIDGSANGTPGTAFSSVNFTTQPLEIGTYNQSTGNCFNGSIDEVRLYSRALSSGDVSELFAFAGSGGGTGGARYYMQQMHGSVLRRLPKSLCDYQKGLQRWQ